jgi:hypothetical protein
VLTLSAPLYLLSSPTSETLTYGASVGIERPEGALYRLVRAPLLVASASEPLGGAFRKASLSLAQ